MAPPIEVEISDNQRHLRVDPAALERLVRIVLAAQDRSRASISLAIVDNAAIHAVNRTHLGHDWPTDVISFGLSDPDEPVLSGELVVSAEMACTSARELEREPDEELALYVVHGLLHLCGFDDHNDDDRRRMRRREGELLIMAGMTNPHDSPSVPADLTVERQPSPGDIDDDAVNGRLVGHRPEGCSWTA